MEIHEEFRIKINDTVKSWCYYPPLDAIVYEGTDALTIIEAGTGCINKTFSLADSLLRGPICVDVVGKQKLAIACGNVFNCRSKFNDVILCDSMLQTTSSDYSDKCCIDLPMPEALMLLEALKTVPSKWDNREKLGFECSLDLEAEDSSDNVWKMKKKSMPEVKISDYLKSEPRQSDLIEC